MIPEHFKIKNTIKYPTSLIVGGLSRLGLEIVDSLLEQGGYVIIVDNYNEENLSKLDFFPKDALVSFIDYTTLPHLDENLRRLDYVFYFNHESINFTEKVSTQDFLKFSNYLDATLSLSVKFDAKFLLSTAIKAHQLVVAREEIDLTYGASSKSQHRIYTEMEVQRYAESLAMEYFEKMNLDSRIIRLGEIIGEGSDFFLESDFNDLIIQAAKNEPLQLKKDGLETEWLVHIIDAAYGIIKAQFSRNTKGGIFSVCYENSFTHLALAYKIQEVDPDSQEIIFLDEKDNLPSLKLYKPAPNLSKIGWNTRIPLEKAIKQSIAAAKIHLLENQGPKNFVDAESSLVGKLKGFLNLADNNDASSFSDDSYSGPVSRLIAERKRQEELKSQSIELATNLMRVKKRKPRTARERVINWFWSGFLEIGNTFKFLKNKTPGQFASLLVSGIFILLLFFYVFSPAVVVFKDLVIAYPEYKKIYAEVVGGRYENLYNTSNRISTSLDSLTKAISIYEPVVNMFGLAKGYESVRATLSTYELAAEGLGNITYALEPYFEYARAYENNLQVRVSADSYLTAKKTSEDYEVQLSNLQDRQPYLAQGIEQYTLAIKRLKNNSDSGVPQFLANRFKVINDNLSQILPTVSLLASAEYLPEIFGNIKSQTYLILLLDNTRLKPTGGEPASFALVTTKNGVITELTMLSVDEVNANLANTSDAILSEINKRKFTYLTKNDLKLSDFSNIYTFKEYSEVVSRLFEDAYNQKISGTLALNYKALESLMNIGNEVIEINGTEVEKNKLLESLKSLQDETSTLQIKHSLSAQIFSEVFYNIVNNFKTNYSEIFMKFTDLIMSQDIQMDFADMEYSEFIQQNNYNSSNYVNSDAFVAMGVNSEDPEISASAYPVTSSALEITVQKDLSISYKLKMQFPNGGNFREISACLPLTVSDSAIKVTSVPADRITINSTSFEKCLVAKVTSEKELSAEWVVPSLISSASENKTLDLALGFGQFKGSNTTSDYELKIDPAVKILKSSTGEITDNSQIISNPALTDQLIELSLQIPAAE
jgi:nucleoside-diphosphate-sugar epimerase